MAVGGVRGGGGKGKAGGARGPSGPSGTGKAFSAGGAGQVDRAESLVGPSGAAGSGNVQGAEPILQAQAMAIAQQLKNGQIPNKGEAAKKFVAEILKEKLRMQSKALTDKIADALQDDPRLNQALERLWSKG
jgi:hypothetical protein